MTGCTGSGETKQVQQPQDTTYTQQAAMDVYDYDPVRALEIIDSAVIAGNMSEVRADFLRARIYSWTVMGQTVDSLLQGPERLRNGVRRSGVRFDSARVIGERLLTHDSVEANLGLRQNVLEVLVYVARQQQDTARWLRRSQELVEVCHGQGEDAEPEALRTEAEVGAVLCQMGQRERGMEKLDSVIAILDSREHRQFNWLDATVIALKRKLGVLKTEGKHIETIPLARRIIDRLGDYERHPQDYHDGSYREPTDSTDRADYIRFYRSQAENFIATAYADLGKTGDMQATFERLENIVIDAETREHLARYHALEQKMLSERQRLEMEAQAQRNLYFAVIVCILLAVALAALAWYFRQMRIVRQKTRALVQQIDESLRYKELYQALKATFPVHTGKLPEADENVRPDTHVADPDAETFAQIHDTIIREGLYLNPNCDRQMLTDRFGLTKERLGSLFVQYSDAKNVSAYINGLRLAHAAHLLTTQPELDIREVAAASGFGSHQYFSTCFKQRFGLSPTDYRSAKGL